MQRILYDLRLMLQSKKNQFFQIRWIYLILSPDFKTEKC